MSKTFLSDILYPFSIWNIEKTATLILVTLQKLIEITSDEIVAEVISDFKCAQDSDIEILLKTKRLYLTVKGKANSLIIKRGCFGVWPH